MLFLYGFRSAPARQDLWNENPDLVPGSRDPGDALGIDIDLGGQRSGHRCSLAIFQEQCAETRSHLVGRRHAQNLEPRGDARAFARVRIFDHQRILHG